MKVTGEGDIMDAIFRFQKLQVVLVYTPYGCHFDIVSSGSTPTALIAEVGYQVLPNMQTGQKERDIGMPELGFRRHPSAIMAPARIDISVRLNFEYLFTIHHLLSIRYISVWCWSCCHVHSWRLSICLHLPQNGMQKWIKNFNKIRLLNWLNIRLWSQWRLYIISLYEIFHESYYRILLLPWGFYNCTKNMRPCSRLVCAELPVIHVAIRYFIEEAEILIWRWMNVVGISSWKVALLYHKFL